MEPDCPAPLPSFAKRCSVAYWALLSVKAMDRNQCSDSKPVNSNLQAYDLNDFLYTCELLLSHSEEIRNDNCAVQIPTGAHLHEVGELSPRQHGACLRTSTGRDAHNDDQEKNVVMDGGCGLLGLGERWRGWILGLK